MAPRTLYRIAAIAASLGTFSGLGIGIAGMPSAAAVTGGRATVVRPSDGVPLTAGGSATAYRLKLPAKSACTGDSAHAGYRVDSYLVPESVSPATLRFTGDGPLLVAGEFRDKLYEDKSGSQFVAVSTANEVSPKGPGDIIQPLPAFSFFVYIVAEGFPIAPGTYNLGIACTVGPAMSPNHLDRYWNTVMTLMADPDDRPAQIRWIVTDATDRGAGQDAQFPAGWAALGVALVALGAVFVLRRRRGLAMIHLAKET